VHQGEGKEDMGGGRCGSRRHFLQGLARMKNRQHGGKGGGRQKKGGRTGLQRRSRTRAMLTESREARDSARAIACGRKRRGGEQFVRLRATVRLRVRGLQIHVQQGNK
jgi:hypothetical protein